MTAAEQEHARYATISERGLQWESIPMRLFQKAKRLGTHLAKDFILRTVALFQAGEEGVTSDLLPLIGAGPR